MVTTAIILCGGKATRLGDLAKDTPKILMSLYRGDFHSGEVGRWNFDIDRPGLTVLSAQIELLKKNGISKFILAVGHLSEVIEEYIAKHHKDDRILISKEGEPLGTGGAFLSAHQEHCREDEIFVGMNGDVYSPELDLSPAFKNITDHPMSYVGAIVLAKYRVPYGIVQTSIHGAEHMCVINKFCEKDVLINAGVYVLKPSIFEFVKEDGIRQFSIEHRIFSNQFHALMGMEYDGPWFDIGTPESLEACRAYVRAYIKAEG